jgi:hypothetical protein
MSIAVGAFVDSFFVVEKSAFDDDLRIVENVRVLREHIDVSVAYE